MKSLCSLTELEVLPFVGFNHQLPPNKHCCTDCISLGKAWGKGEKNNSFILWFLWHHGLKGPSWKANALEQPSPGNIYISRAGQGEPREECDLSWLRHTVFVGLFHEIQGYLESPVPVPCSLCMCFASNWGFWELSLSAPARIDDASYSSITVGYPVFPVSLLGFTSPKAEEGCCWWEMGREKKQLLWQFPISLKHKKRMFLLTHRTKIVLGLRSSLTGVLFLHQLIPLRRAETKEVVIGVIISQKANTK